MTRAIIVGAGIGGLTSALCLERQGIEAEIYESVNRLAPLGVGINLLPHACQVLDQLGVLDALLETGVETQELLYFNAFGQQIWREPRGRAAGYPWPQISIHRGELQMRLLDAVQRRLGQDAVKTGMTALSALNDGVAARVTLQRASGEQVDVSGDVVIAADGIHSALRRQFYPDEGMPLWNGAVLWRGLCDSEPFLSGRSMFMAGHQDQKFVAYPVDQQAFERGRSLTNWIAELRYPVATLAEREDWNRAGDFTQFQPSFSSWQFPWLNVADLIADAPSCYEFPMVDRDPVDRWSFERITLLGDAAHPMYPIGSNGASQAVLDAACLTRCLTAAGADVVSGLRAYEAERLPATAAIVRANRGNGPEQVMQLAHERAPDGFADVDEVIPLAEREAIAAQYKQVAGFAKDVLAQSRL